MGLWLFPFGICEVRCLQYVLSWCFLVCISSLYLPHLSFLLSEMAQTDGWEDVPELRRQLVELEDAINKQHAAIVPVSEELGRCRLLYRSYEESPAYSTEFGKARAKFYRDAFWATADRINAMYDEYNLLRQRRDYVYGRMIRAMFKPRLG